MINLIDFFPDLSSIIDIILVESLEEYNNNIEYINEFNQIRVDTLKGKKFLEEIEQYVPYEYHDISNKIWDNVIRDLLKRLEKEEEYLISSGLKSFAIFGHTEGFRFRLWQLFDKSRYTEYNKNKL